MRSAFGVEHGEIAKYHKVFGTNRLVEREQQEQRRNRMAQLKEKVTFNSPPMPPVKNGTTHSHKEWGIGSKKGKGKPIEPIAPVKPIKSIGSKPPSKNGTSVSLQVTRTKQPKKKKVS